jgi:hypothetical protein
MKKLARRILQSDNRAIGKIHNFSYRHGKYATIVGSVCVNNINYNGIEFGHFVCPIEGFDYEATNCCGKIYEQYCCTSLDVASDKAGFYSAYIVDNNLKNKYIFSRAGLENVFFLVLFSCSHYGFG